MANKQEDTKQVDLNEIFEQIKSAGQRTFKDKDDNTYCSVYTSRLRSWALALKSVSNDLQKFDVTKQALLEAEDQINQLTRASNAKDLKLQELKDLASNADKAAKEQRAKHQKEIAAKQKELQLAKDRYAEANSAKVDTAKALMEAEAKLKSPEAKFVPEEAKRLQAEVAALKQDLELANAAIATERAAQGDLNRNIDALYKAAAAKDKLNEDAKAQLSNFKRQLAAAQAQNVDDFDLEEVDFASLETTFGSRGVEKIRNILNVPAWDTRGRIQKLTGFFQVVGKSINRTFYGMLSILEKALELVRNKTSSWSGVIFPWVNGLLKDIIFFQLKPAKHYREELEAVIAAVKGKLPSDSFKEKRDAAHDAMEDKTTWQQRLEESRKRVADAMSDLDTATGKFFKRCKDFVSSFKKGASERFKATKKSLSRGGARLYNAVKQGLSIGIVFFQAAWSAASDDRYDHTKDPRRYTHDYDLSTGKWVKKGPIELFDAEKLD